MALERQNLHEELVAMFAAARELPPDHDHALADVFMSRLHAPAAVPQPTLWDVLRQHTAALIGAGALSLAALTFLLFSAAMAHDGDRGDRGFPFDRGAFHDRSPFNQNGPPEWQQQSPTFPFPNDPTQPAAPNT